MKFTQKNLKELIKEELEKLLSETVYQTPMSEPGKTEADEGEQAAGAGIEALGALGEECGCGDHPEEEVTERPGDIVTALEDAMRALGDALKYMRGEEEESVGDIVADLGDEAAAVNVGPMEEGVMMIPSESALGAIIIAASQPIPDPEENPFGHKNVTRSSKKALDNLNALEGDELGFLKSIIRRKSGLGEEEEFDIESIERVEGGVDKEERPIATVEIRLSTGGVVGFPYKHTGPSTRSRRGARIAGSKKGR